jgi:hypothetical protein
MSETSNSIAVATPLSSGRVATSAAVAAATGAVACGVCCVLPFALPAALLAGSGGILTWFAGARSWMTIVAIVAVVGAWLWIWIQSFRTKRRSALSTILTMTGATVLAGTALVWLRLEPLVFALVRN